MWSFAKRSSIFGMTRRVFEKYSGRYFFEILSKTPQSSSKSRLMVSVPGMVAEGKKMDEKLMGYFN
jgi:hypothetical protein